MPNKKLQFFTNIVCQWIMEYQLIVRLNKLSFLYVSNKKTSYVSSIKCHLPVQMYCLSTKGNTRTNSISIKTLVRHSIIQNGRAENGAIKWIRFFISTYPVMDFNNMNILK